MTTRHCIATMRKDDNDNTASMAILFLVPPNKDLLIRLNDKIIYTYMYNRANPIVFICDCLRNHVDTLSA